MSRVPSLIGRPVSSLKFRGSGTTERLGVCGRGGRRVNARAGFTLLEILVAVLIITILATVVGVNLAKRPGEARMAAAKSQLGAFKTALQLYRMDMGRYPSQRQGLAALFRKPTVPPVPEKYREEGYMASRNLPSDPWGHDYVYLTPGSDGNPYEIVSYGADGEPGGTGEDTDLSTAEM